MDKQKIINQSNRIKRNPTRFNTNVNQGKKDETKFDEQNDVDRIGSDRSSIDKDVRFHDREATTQADGQIDEIKKGNQQSGKFNQQS